MNVAERLTRAFPSELAGPAGAVASRIASAGGTLSPDSFEVTVDGEAVGIPERLYVNDVAMLSSLSGTEADVAACVLSRHHDGHIRARALGQVLELNSPWSAPFVVRLIGEYVIEILEQIDVAFVRLDPSIMQVFATQNPAFLRITEARVRSYWDRYHRNVPASEFVGFRLIGLLVDTGAGHTSP